jgi:hypothetical protein
VILDMESLRKKHRQNPSTTVSLQYNKSICDCNLEGGDKQLGIPAYEQHRSWKVGSGNRQRICKASAVTVPPIKGDCDVARARYRYLKLNKAELVERLLGVEQAHAVLQERWFQVNEQMLSWRLRAERIDPQLRRTEE